MLAIVLNLQTYVHELFFVNLLLWESPSIAMRYLLFLCQFNNFVGYYLFYVYTIVVFLVLFFNALFLVYMCNFFKFLTSAVLESVFTCIFTYKNRQKISQRSWTCKIRYSIDSKLALLCLYQRRQSRFDVMLLSEFIISSSIPVVAWFRRFRKY